MEEWLDVPQLEEQTTIPATTIHRYLSKFNKFFIFKGGKRSRRYDSSAIPVLLRIKELYSRGFGSLEVEKQLSKEFPVLLTNDQSEAPLDNSGLPALATTEDMAELKEGLKQQAEFNRRLLQNDLEQRDLIKALLQDREEQKQLMLKIYETMTKELPAPDQSEVNEQQEINKRILQELAESKQRDQVILDKFAELEKKKEVEAAPIEKPAEKKKGFFKRFLS